MTTLTATNPFVNLTFLPLWKEKNTVTYPRRSEYFGVSTSEYSNENPIPMSYNQNMEWETWLNNLLESNKTEKYLSIIDEILDQGTFDQKHQTSVVRNALARNVNSESLFSLLDKTPIDAYKADDDVILIEWSFKNFGFGFCLAPDSSDSGWYLTSNEKAGNLLRSGLLNSDSEINSVTTSMISMLQEHIGELNL